MRPPLAHASAGPRSSISLQHPARGLDLDGLSAPYSPGPGTEVLAPRPGGGVAAAGRSPLPVRPLVSDGARPAVCARQPVRRTIPLAAALAAPARGEPQPAPRTARRVDGGRIGGRLPGAVACLRIRQAAQTGGARQPVRVIPVVPTADTPAGRAVSLASR